MKLPSATQINKALSEIRFNPAKPSPTMGIILESGNSEYFRNRAIELIRGAGKKSKREDNILAVRLLLVAALMDSPYEVVRKPKTKLRENDELGRAGGDQD